MTKFFDYDMTTFNGRERYALRLGTKKLGDGRCCLVYQSETLPTWWTRKTRWYGNGSVRYEYFRTLDEALASGIKWARRRFQEDEREALRQELRASETGMDVISKQLTRFFGTARAL